MPPVKSYRELIVWQKAMDLTVAVYAATRGFPRDEIYGLTSQLRRSTVAVASNIAEGQGRATRGEFRQFLGHARGSLQEADTQVLLAQRLDYLNEHTATRLLEQIAEVGRLINGLLRSLETSH